MNAKAIALCIICQLLIVAGQLCLKRGMTPTAGRAVQGMPLAGGIFLMAIWFFLWIGLLSTWDLSKVFPFEGLNPAMMVIAAGLILREKVAPRAWAGIALVCAGIFLVAAS